MNTDYADHTDNTDDTDYTDFAACKLVGRIYRLIALY